ncbi:MAG: hypothetical protein VB105_03055 [Paludibacter sp.]|nr:hypothetical protein [Paludibacter sp.]
MNLANSELWVVGFRRKRSLVTDRLAYRIMEDTLPYGVAIGSDNDW